MENTADNNRFLHTGLARLIALILGAGILAFMFLTWGSEMKQLANALINGRQAPIITPVGSARIKSENPALAACLAERVGDVEKMKADGVINAHQYAQFSERARALCIGQNP